MAALWVPRQRNYRTERSRLVCKAVQASSHPLKAGSQVTEKKAPIVTASSRKGNVAIDPLNALDGSDPLSLLAGSSDPLSVLSISASDAPAKQNVSADKADKRDGNTETRSWSEVKSEILTRYTTSEKLSITTSFLTGGDTKRVIKQSTVSDTVKHRLEQLDDFEDGSVKEMLNLSQQDYIKRIDELNTALTSSWNQDQRVKALKIAIQCAKLLADTSVVQFYPSKFVLISEILDTFARLVFERIWEKSTYIPAGSTKAVQLPENFTPEQVPESAKETCRNWFFKIASIRELIPRFYVETAILRCYKFFKPSEMTEALTRLAGMIKGIGNPLVAAYARCYLCQVGKTINPSSQGYINSCFQDVLLTYGQLQLESGMVSKAQGVALQTYLSLYTPAYDWVLQCLAHQAADSLIDQVLEQCNKQANSALLLNAILRSFKAEFIALRATTFINMIRDCEEAGFPKHVLYASLGTRLALADPLEADKLTILNEVWKFITKLKEPSDYIHCVEVWINFVMKHFGKREMNTALGDIIKHMTPDRAFEDFYPNLLNILKQILDQVHNFSLLFSLDKFMSFIDLFQKETVKVGAARIVVESFIKYQLEPTSDPVIISCVMFSCRMLHDSVNALSLDDERRSVSQLISSFIHIVNFGNNFEQQLDFYAESRANFTNLDSVITDLVQCVNNLAIATRRIVKGNHTKKTSAFVRACSAYCFITIPSLQNTFTQLTLYLLSGQTSLLNRCVSQADALLKAGIATLLEAPTTMMVDGKARTSEPFITQYINHLLSVLLTVPDNPDQGVLVLIKGVINVIKTYPFEVDSDVRVTLYLSVLTCLCALSQQTYLYHVDKLESNDALYGHDTKFLGEVNKVCSLVFEEIITILKSLSEGFENMKKQSLVTLQVLEHLMTYADLGQEDVFQLARNMWNLSQKSGCADITTVSSTISLMRRKAQGDRHVASLLGKLSLQATVV